MITKIITILECSRIYSLPMTLMSWLVAFTYGVLDFGNAVYGIVSLIGICFAHLATNVLDDYFDYRALIKQVDFDKAEYLKNTQKTKCRSILSGIMSEKDVLHLGLVYLALAGIIGLFLFKKCGMPVLYFALAGGVVSVIYSFMSKIKLSEIMVALTYGPILFGGVYYVMTKTLSWESVILSLSTMFVTVILLYVHTIMDYDFDIKEGHLTIANSFDSQLDALIVLKILIVLAYLAPIFICIFNISDWQVLLVYLTLPLSIDLYNSMKDFALAPESVPEKKWYHFPMENMARIRQLGAEAFMIRMYQSRNLMIYYSMLLTLGLIFASL